MSVNSGNIILEPCHAYLGDREKTTVTAVADVALSLEDTYFELAEAGSATLTHYVWLDGGTGTDPLLTDKTAIPVTYTSGDSAAVIAGLIQAAIDAVAKFNASVSGSVVTIENVEIGASAATVDSGTTGFTIVRSKIGSKTDLGGTEGGIEIAFEPSMVDVTADQTGAQVIDSIMNGNSVTASMSLKEMTAAKWALIMGSFSGDTLALTTDVVGYGESKRFTNMLQYAKELVLVPVTSAAGNNLRNYNFWKAVPIPGSVNLSGTDVQQMDIAFTIYRDTTKNTKINLFAFGDGTQKVIA